MVVHGSTLCAAHHPDYRERRRAGARKGGRKSQGAAAELATVKAELRGTIEAVRGGDLDKGTGAILSGLYNTLLRALDLQRRWHEADELEQRIAALEQDAEQQQGASWGA